MSAFFHQCLSCTQSCMPPVSEGDGKQQPFTLTFTPVDNSVHLMCVSLDWKPTQRQAEYTNCTHKGSGN